MCLRTTPMSSTPPTNEPSWGTQSNLEYQEGFQIQDEMNRQRDESAQAAPTTTPDELTAEIERLMDAYWGVSGHNRDEKRPIYARAIERLAAHNSLYIKRSVVKERVMGLFYKDIFKVVNDQTKKQIEQSLTKALEDVSWLN